MNKKEKQLLDRAMTIAGEALYLAGAYSGNDSETVRELEKQFDLLEEKIQSLDQ